jgi:hypothetical protein
MVRVDEKGSAATETDDEIPVELTDVGKELLRRLRALEKDERGRRFERDG